MKVADLMKPCPLCNSRGDLEEIVHNGEATWLPYCTATETVDECLLGHTELRFARKVDAVAAWNRRPAPTLNAAPGLDPSLY